MRQFLENIRGPQISGRQWPKTRCSAVKGRWSASWKQAMWLEY